MRDIQLIGPRHAIVNNFRLRPVSGQVSAPMNIREAQQQLEDSIAQAIESAEGLHRLSASSVFEQLAQVAPVSAIVQNIRPAYENGAGQVFDLCKALNRSGGDAVRMLLDRAGI
jgi:hypothetical protein